MKNESDDLKMFLEGIEIPPDRIDQIMEVIKGIKKDGPRTIDNVASVEQELKLMMSKETDWRKKAAIAARIISINL